MYTTKLKKLFKTNLTLFLGLAALIGFTLILVCNFALPDTVPKWITSVVSNVINLFFIIFVLIISYCQLVIWNCEYKNKYVSTKLMGIFSIIFGVLGSVMIFPIYLIVLGAFLINLNKSDKGDLEYKAKLVEEKSIKLYLWGFGLFTSLWVAYNIINAVLKIYVIEKSIAILDWIIIIYLFVNLSAFVKAWTVIRKVVFESAQFNEQQNYTTGKWSKPFDTLIVLGMIFGFGAIVLYSKKELDKVRSLDYDERVDITSVEV